ncbi:hypothetical protein JZ785_08535 [Alicyclobacillus curvatus]|jgi:hypothetical protein|nr:hypothetical protein JZ785_08535 [Alicyclobacillus curvatus]
MRPYVVSQGHRIIEPARSQAYTDREKSTVRVLFSDPDGRDGFVVGALSSRDDKDPSNSEEVAGSGIVMTGSPG